MTRLFFVSLCLFLFSFSSTAQVFPSPNAKLHYRVIPFSLPVQTNASQYTVSVAKGNYTDEALFKKNISIRKNDSSSKIIVEVPSFATDYTWQWTYKKLGKTISSPLYHFSTLRYPYSDSLGNYSSRMRVTKTTDKYVGSMILVDCTRTMYDMEGNPIWFVPESLCPELTHGSVQDLKMTKEGTITFIYVSQAFEIDYYGNVITHLSSVKSGVAVTDVFHHELTKIGNGNFMVLGRAFYLNKYTQYKNAIAKNAKDSADMYRQIEMGTLLEFDKKGKLVWDWNSNDYFSKSDLVNMLNDKDNTNIDFHLNAFTFNEIDNSIYLGFKNISRIVKVQYPSKKIINSYGKVYTNPIDTNDLFCFQHSITHSGKDTFYVFNNNACGNPAIPELIKFSESANTFGIKGLTEIWKHKFENVTIYNQSTFRRPGQDRAGAGNRGGCFYLLDNGYYFVSLNGPYNELHILDDKGRYYWSSFLETFSEVNQKWESKATYRSCLVTPNLFKKSYNLSN